MYKIGIIISLFLFSCGSQSLQHNGISSNAESLSPSDSIAGEELKLPYGLEMVMNIELVDFCVPVPVKDYSSQVITNEKAQLVFGSVTNQNSLLKIQGLLRSDTSVAIEDYFKNSYPETDELNGKIIERKKIVTETKCFYAMGYYNNLIHTSRFIEITWLRADDLVKYNVSFPVKDTLLWQQRLAEIVKCDSRCR